MATLLWIEHDESEAHPQTAQLIHAAQLLGKPIVALVAGSAPKAVAEQVSKLAGIDKVWLCCADYYYPFRAEPHAKLLQELASDFDSILTLATTTGKNILPRFAALVDQSMISDVIAIDADKVITHPIYAGNALSKQKVQQSKLIATIRSSAFEKGQQANQSAPIESIPAVNDDPRSKVLAVAQKDHQHQDLQTAKIVVSGGRGLGSQEQFQLVEKLADTLGAAVGATRAAVDAGFVSNDYQVGQTGKIVAPELYIAVGISGAVQHLAGMKDSKMIVAINKDAEAPIFEIATYGLVGDLFTIVPELTQKLA